MPLVERASPRSAVAFFRGFPPGKTAEFGEKVDAHRIAAIEEVFKLEEHGDVQKEPLFVLAATPSPPHESIGIQEIASCLESSPMSRKP